MTHRSMRFTLAALLVAGSSYAMAQSPWAVSPTWSHASDSDGLVIDKWAARALPHYRSGLEWQGVEWQQQRYTQNGQTLTGQGIHYIAQNLNALSGMGYAYKLGVNQGPERSLVTGEANWNQALNDQVEWGLFASRDWVESLPALQHQVHYDLVGGNVDYRVHPRVTLIGSLAQTHFSDGQDRQQQRARAIWDAWPEQGVTLQWSHKHQLGEKDVAQRRYFNPERLDESMGLIGWRRKFEGWQGYARFGHGQQRIANQETTPARLAELELSSPIYGASYFKIRAGRTETFGYYQSGNDGPGYVYRYIDAQWIVQLGR